MDPDSASTHLFVYGTLRRATDNPMHQLLYGTTLVGTGIFQGKLYDLGNYPAAVPSDDPADRVHGEVYRLDDPPTTLALLDRYEACTEADAWPHEYVRTVVPIRLDDGGEAATQIYLYNRAVAELTPVGSGDYLRWRAQLAAPSVGA